jgi:hypothetical protein
MFNEWAALSRRSMTDSGKRRMMARFCGFI